MGQDESAAVASLSMRKSGNPFSTLVFSGVKERRQHAFAFDFYPRNSIESDRILTIIKRLKRLLPKASPAARSAPPDPPTDKTELTPVANSGSEVAVASKTTPTKERPRPVLKAIMSAFLVS